MFDASERIARLSREQRSLLEQRLRGRKARPPELLKIRPREQRNVAPLSFAQQRLWFLEHWDPGTAVYNVSIPLRIRGPLDVSALERGLNKLVERHEVLRTYLLSTFRGEPSQVVLPQLTVQLPIVPLSLTEDERATFLEDLIERESRQPIPLHRAPLFRGTVYRFGPDDHVLFFLIHHIVYDSWSLGIFLKEWFAHYNALVAGQELALPELPFQYGDFAIWQREQIDNDLHRKQSAYWTRQLADRENVVELLTDHPRPPHLTYQGKLHRLDFPPELKRAVAELSRAEGTTFYVTALSAFSVLLHHYTGQSDLIVGTPVAHRPYSETEPLIGYFVNTLPVRVKPAGEQSFRELVRQVQDTVLSALNNLSLPFERVIDELKLERDTSRSPLFQVFFATQKSQMPAFETGSLRVESFHLDNGTSMFELSFFLYEEGDGDVLQYNSDLFDEVTVEMLGKRLLEVLQAAVEDPTKRLQDFSVLADGEQQRLAAWSQGPVLDVPAECIHRRFEQQAALTPHAVALVCGGQSLTYRELDERANRLARHLQRQGAGREVRIGLCVDRSPMLVVSLLGILKAGAAYVPLDHEYPRDRLALMLEDARISLLVVESDLRGTLPDVRCPVVLIDEDWEVIARESADPVTSTVGPDNVAYVIYTSGSTGRPKGVEVLHDSVVNFLDSMRLEPGLTASDTLAAITSISFDIAGLELYLPLVCGARIVLATRDQATDSYQLVELLESSGATVLQATPASWRMLLDAGWKNPARIKMLVGGEALPRDLATRLLAVGGELWNLYGPTEVTIWATVARILPNSETISIGRPIANTQAYVLDRSLRPVPIGGVGDLYLGGRGLARGYLHAPELTAERFIRNPFGTAPGDRLYRTGDRARYRFDGTLEYLGRTDQQVKLHGFRIELEEIEVALREHPAVREAAVALREDAPGQQRLVGYVVPDPAYRDEQGEGSAEAEHVSGWLALYDQVYQEDLPGQHAEFNTVGWNSSYTGAPIAAEEMREQVDQTTKRVLALRPKRVLELGCGTGLHVSRIAPHTELYVATDGSASALAALGRQPALAALPQVRLQQRQAHDLASLRGESFDCVLINSVIQYFPDVDYLLKVLTGAADLLQEGTICVADVRDFRLLEAYHTSVQLAKAADELPCERLRQQIASQIRNENELLVDPALFMALPEQIPALGSVEIQLRRGRFHNELTRFRYDALLHVGKRVPDEVGVRWNWPVEHLSLGELERRLGDRSLDLVEVEQIPNARLAEEMKAMALLLAEGGPRTAGELRQALRAERLTGIDPEDLWALGAKSGFHVQLGWARPGEGADGTYRATLRRQRLRHVSIPPAVPTALDAERPSQRSAWSRFANDLRQRRFRELVPQLRRFVEARLPAYMVPAVLTAVEALPLTPNGKLDRRRLPAPVDMTEALERSYVEPRTEEQRRFAQIWADVLRLERVGMEDDYFALGGDSVRSILLISRAKEAGFIFTSKQLFEHRTVAAVLEAMQRQASQQPEQEQEGGTRPLPGVQEIAHLVTDVDAVEAVFPATPYQRWAVKRFRELGDPALYLTQPYYRIRNEQFDPDLFDQAWQRTVALHQALRTRFVWEGLATPLQVVLKGARAEVNRLDLRHLPYEEQQSKLEEFLAADFRRGIVAEPAPHLRVGLVRLDQDDYVFVYTIDHMLQDGWSMTMFLRDALLHYAALKEGRAPDLRVRRPYADVLRWSWQQDRRAANAFFKRMLAGFRKPNQLVTHDVPLTSDNEVLCKDLFLSSALSTGLYDLCKQFQITFSNFIAGVWSIVMSEETGDDDVLFGLVMSGRPAHMEGIEYTVGNMINLLPLRLRIQRDQPFISWMKELQPIMWELKSHEQADLLTVWEESEMSAAAPPFQSYITYQSQPLDPYALTVGQHWAQGAMKTGRTALALKLEVLPIAQVGLRLQYYKDCFDDRAIPRMSDSLGFLLQLIQDDSRKTLGEMKDLLRKRRSQSQAAGR
jgi:amino acid adenylation domain-containing protein